MYIEVVQGFGETLVGNCPGQALQATVSKQALQELSLNANAASDAAVAVDSQTAAAAVQAVTMRAYPSKSVAFTLPCSSTSALDTSAFIFRSDSNGEDLEG